MKVTLLLADSAQVVNNKLYILGGGWSVTGPQPSPIAIAVKIEVPWDQTNRPHTLRLELVDQDGKPVKLKTQEGDREIVAESNFEVGRPPGIPQGTPIDISLAFNFQPLPIPPGGRYTWQLFIDDETREGWEASFSTRRAKT